MRRQARPFIVEIKQKRGAHKSGRSIWGDLDLSSIAAETREDVQQPSGRLVDSNVTVVDAESQRNPRAEQDMADPQDAESTQGTTELPATPSAPEPKKKPVRARKARAGAKQATAKNSSRPSDKAVEALAPATRDGRKTYSEKERSQKLSQIKKAIAGGVTTKSAVAQAGISEQTYYQWKKTRTAIPPVDGDDLKDLLALEDENKRLKSLLAERLRKENAELKKKLGMA